MGFAGHFGWDLPVKLNGIARSFSVGLSTIKLQLKIYVPAFSNTSKKIAQNRHKQPCKN
jgi:hypothetical protein